MSSLRPHTIHVIEYGDSICYKEMVNRIIEYLEDYHLYKIENEDCTVYECEIYESELLDAIDECVDDNIKNTLQKLYNESDKRDSYIHFSVF